MTTQNELKPCPFCGGAPEIKHRKSSGFIDIICTGCSAGFEDQENTSVWNTRPAYTRAGWGQRCLK